MQMREQKIIFCKQNNKQEKEKKKLSKTKTLFYGDEAHSHTLRTLGRWTERTHNGFVRFSLLKDFLHINSTRAATNYEIW